MQVSRAVQLTAVAASVSLLAACGGDDAEPSTGASVAADEALTIDFGTPSDVLSSSFYAFIAADALGYWDDENLTVNLVPGSGSGALVEQMVAGNLVAGAPSLPAVVEGLGAGLDLLDVYTYSYGSIFGIWVPEDSDVQGVEDLEGLNIGVSEPGGGETAVLTAALNDVGIDAVTGVNLIPIGSGEATTLDAIESGRVDAYASSKNDGFSIEVSGLKLRDITPPLYEGFPGRSIITTPESLEENREQLVRLSRGIAKATLFCDHNMDACRQFTIDAVPEQWVGFEDGQDSQGSLQLEEAVRTTSVPDDVEFGRHDFEQMAAFRDTVAAITDGFEPFEPEEFMVSDLLDEINDFDREAIIAEAESFSS